jgi:hypothetical protein
MAIGIEAEEGLPFFTIIPGKFVIWLDEIESFMWMDIVSCYLGNCTYFDAH